MQTEAPDTTNDAAGGASAVERVVRREIGRIRLMNDISEGMCAPAPTRVLEMALGEIERLRAALNWIADNGPDEAWVLRHRAREALTPNYK